MYVAPKSWHLILYILITKVEVGNTDNWPLWSIKTYRVGFESTYWWKRLSL